MAYEITTPWSFTIEFDTRLAQHNGATLVDATHYVNFWYGEAAQAIVGAFVVSTSNGIINAAAANLNWRAGQVANLSPVMIDSTHVLLFCSDSSANGLAEVFTINLGNWTITEAGSEFAYDNRGVGNNKSWQVDANHFINFWKDNDDSNGHVQIFEVNTSNWTVTTAAAWLEFDTAYIQWQSMSKVDANHFINFWAGSGTDGFTQIFEVNTSTWVITTADARLEFETQYGSYNSCNQIDDNHFINFFSSNGVVGSVQTFTVNTSTWAITTAAALLTFDTVAYATYHYSAKVDENHFMNSWKDADGDGQAQNFEVNTTTWEVTTVSAKFEFETTKVNNSLVAVRIDDGHTVLIWADNDLDGRAWQLFSELPTSGPANIAYWGTTAPAAIDTMNTTTFSDIVSINTVT